MRLSVVQAALAGPGVPPDTTPGVYVWASHGNPDAEVLYIGEAVNLWKRTTDEELWTQTFLNNRGTAMNLWDCAGCGLEAVLARHRGRRPITWPLPPHERKHVQLALIRVAALTGATPPGQGAGWDYGKGKPGSTDDRASMLLRTWFAGENFNLHIEQHDTTA